MKTTFERIAREHEASLRLVHPGGQSGENETATLVAGDHAHNDHYVLEIGLDSLEGSFNLKIRLSEEEYNSLLKGDTIYPDQP